jgi:peptidoglycan/LPS O-acetylase OafA/YrhL
VRATNAGSKAGTAATRQSFYRPELDVLRFGAFLLVFIHHGFPLTAAEYAGWRVPQTLATLFAAGARAGALGVDLFFALSAYLITELLLREQRSEGRFDIRAFYTRRILRIWPLYYFALLVLLPLLALAMPADKMPGKFLLAFLFFSGNWACAWWNLYPTSLALLWSVSIEEQFYVIWPWLMRLFGSRMPLCACGMLAVSTITRAFLIGTRTDLTGMDVRIWTNTLARLDPIAGGALLALLLRGRIPKHTLRRRVLWIGGGGAGLWIAGSVLKDPGWIWLLTYPLAAAACVAILFGSFRPEGVRAYRILAYLGKISYGLYVFHVAAIRMVQTITGPSLAGPIVLLIAFALTVAAAALSYRYLESPFLRWKIRYAHVETRTV